jgi:hypothetical protein
MNIGGGGSPVNPGDQPRVTNSIRYQAIPDTSIGDNKIKYSYTYGDYDFYYIYLGELRNIPLFYDAAKRHSWNYSSSTYTWSTTSATTSTVSNAVTRTSYETVSVTNQHTVEKTKEINFHEEASVKYKGLFVSAEAKFSADQKFKEFTSDTTTTGYQKTTSLTDTVKWAESNTESLKRSDSYTFTQADREGYYRYTCFSVSDVYLYVVRNPITNEIYYEFREYIVPGKEFWDMDYCETPDFKKNDSTRFAIDTSILNNLPATKVNLGGDPPPTLPPPPDPVFKVTNISEWDAACSVIKSNGNGKKYTITVIGDVMVTGRTTATFGTVSDVEVTLNGNNGKLYLGSQGRLLTIDSFQTVIIDSPTLTLQGLSEEDKLNNNDSLVRVNAGGNLELKNGNIINNTNYIGGNPTSRYGGGVYVASGGSFTMSGGTIKGNTSDSRSNGNTSVYINSDSRGGGVYVNGGSFTMTAGTIEDNKAFSVSGASGGTNRASSQSRGGGVYVESGSFTMSGGTISKNKSENSSSTNTNSRGGGVCVNGGSFTMSGGEIKGNTSTSGSVTNATGSYSYGYGGGVAVEGGGSFTMTSGTISKNSASGGGAKSNLGPGGGVFVENSSFSKSGSSYIYGNDAVNEYKNTASDGYTVFWDKSGNFYFCNATVGSGNNMSTSDPLPTAKGQTVGYWTRGN